MSLSRPSSNAFGSSLVVPSAGVVSFEEARHLVEQHAAAVSPGDPETVDLLAGFGRGVGGKSFAGADFSPFFLGARGGYLVCEGGKGGGFGQLGAGWGGEGGGRGGE